MRTGGWLGRPHRRAHASGGKTSWVVPRATTAFFFLAFIVFTCVEPYLGQVNNPNENTRTYLTMAIVEHHTFHLDEIVDRQGWVGDLGRAREPADFAMPAGERARPHAKRTFTDARLAQNVAEGKFYMSVKAPATSYFGVPVYWAFMKLAPHFGHKVPTAASPPVARAWWLRAATFTLRLFTVQLPCFFFLVWFERWLRRSTDDIVLRLAAVTAVGFGSNFLAYALMYVSHATSAVAAFLAFGIIMRTRLGSLSDARRRGVGTAFVVGLLVGMIPLLEYTGLPLAAVLAVYGLATFWRPKQLALFALGGVIDVLGLTFYQARACESWKSPCPKLAEGYAWLHTKTFGFGKPSLSFLKDASFSHSSGFFGMSPFMWLGLLAIPFGLFAVFGTPTEKRERRLATAVWLTSMLLLWLFVSAASNPHGGWSVGPRYLGPASPFFAFGAVLALEHIARRGRPWRIVARAAAGGLAIAGAAQVGLVSLVYNTVSDTTQRPLANLALPLARAGFVPHHAAELVGWATPTFWYVVAGCLVGAAVLAAAWPARDTAWSWTLRFAGVIAFATVGLAPAFSPLSPTLPNDVHFPPYLANLWEPPGRDRITKLREGAERLKPARPCVWHTIADLERDLSMVNEANRDDARAELPRSQCK